MKDKEKLSLVIFIALMGTSTLALTSNLIFNNFLTDAFSYILELSIIIVFLFYFSKFVVHIFKKKDFVENLRDPLKSNLYSSIPIAAALISLMLTNIGLPYLNQHTGSLSIFFWLLSLIFSLIFVVLVPINLKFKSKVEHVSGTWFLPPVGLFVLITAGSTLTLKTGFLPRYMFLINLLLFGPAFVLYFLTLTLVYFRSKFYELSQEKIAPTFNIVLAPVAVSILAMISTSKLLLKYDLFDLSGTFLGISRVYSIVIFGYGLWILFGLLSLYYKIIKQKEKIPFSELWWAFVFPTGAFTLATINLHSFVVNFPFFEGIYYLLYFILLFLWIYIFLKQSIIYFDTSRKKKNAKIWRHTGGENNISQ